MKKGISAEIEINKNILWKQVDDEIVIVDPDKNDYAYLNATGAAVWRLINEGKTKAAIVEELCSRYDAPREKIAKDVGSLLSEFVQAGFTSKG